MSSDRVDAFSDGVLAIIITIMVLELHVPEEPTFGSFVDTTGISLLTYVLSFVYVGIYWSNHHHLFQLVHEVGGAVLWANSHLLFWLSLFPFTTRWMDGSRLDVVPTVVYGINLLAAAVAYFLLQQAIIRRPNGHRVREALGRDLKGKVSPFLYLLGIGLAFIEPWIGILPFVGVALMWLVPDRRVESYLEKERADDAGDAT